MKGYTWPTVAEKNRNVENRLNIFPQTELQNRCCKLEG